MTKSAGAEKSDYHRFLADRGPLSDDFLARHAPDYRKRYATGKITADGIVHAMDKRGANIHAENHYLMRWAACNNNLPLMQYLHARGGDLGVYMGEPARVLARNGNIEALLWIHSQGQEISTYNLAQFFKMAACMDENTAAMDALYRINPQIIKETRDDSDDVAEIINRCLRNGLIKSLSWLSEHGLCLDHDPRYGAFERAVESGSVALLEFLKSSGIPVPTSASVLLMHSLCKPGNLPVVEWLDRHGCVFDMNSVAHAAALRRDPDILRWAMGRGGKIPETTANFVMESDDIDYFREIRKIILEQRALKFAPLVAAACDDAIRQSQSRPSFLRRAAQALRLS